MEAYLKTYSDRTIRNVFWSGNNYALPQMPAAGGAKIIYWYGDDEKEGPPEQHLLHQALFPADPDPRDPENGARGAGHRASGGILPVRGEIPGRAGGGGTARRDAGSEDDQMKDNELQFDRSCHVLYSKPCKKGDPGKDRAALSGGGAGGRVGAGAAAVCGLPLRLAHRPWRQEEFPQRRGRHL